MIQRWVRDGWLNAAPGRMVGFDFVAAHLAETVGVYEVKALAYDSYGFRKHFEPELDALGLDLLLMEQQGGKKKSAETGLWTPDSKLALEQLILEGPIRLRRSPVLVAAMMSARSNRTLTWASSRRASWRLESADVASLGSPRLSGGVRTDAAGDAAKCRAAQPPVTKGSRNGSVLEVHQQPGRSLRPHSAGHLLRRAANREEPADHDSKGQ
ncbi:hypothetical protein [Falsiroseomonas sp. HW251]|uniref:hypothetical protein n=1 Tax=Falsiroseomonas sp. HW251 TaxID=3390998 RepID=UPI003D32315B